MAEENENVSKGESTSIDNIAPKVTVNPITGLPFGGGTINPETNQPDKNPITGKKFGLGLLDSKGKSNFGNYKSTHSTLGGKGFSPSNIFTDTYSMYNMEPMENYKKYGVTMGRNFDFDEIRARNQSTGETVMRGIGGALVTFGGALLENTIGFFAGLGEMATGGAYYDNAIGKSVDKMNAWVDEYAPIYKTKAEEKYSTWQKMGTAHFWADDVLGGAAYTAAAAASMYLTGGGGLMTKGLKTVATRAALYNTTKAVINGTQIAKNVGQGANISNRLWQASQVLEAGAMMSLAEASVEARETQKSTYDTLVENYLEQHKTADINNIPKDKLKEFEDISYSAGNTNFVMQMPVLMGTNLLMFGRSVSGFKVGSSINKDVIWDSATKSYVSKFAGDGFMASTLAKLKPFAQQGLNEAFQEAYQFGSSAYASSYHIDKYENNGNGDISKSLAAGWDAINTQEGFESALIGFITGGVFGGVGAIKAKQYSTNVERADRLAGVLNGGTLINAAASYQSANAVEKASKDMEAHLKNGDIKKYQDARFNLIAAQSMEMLERGGLELYIEQLEESSNFADPEFKKLYRYLETDKHGAPISIEKQSDGKNKHEVIDGMVKKVRQFEKTFNNVNERFPLPDRTTGLPRLLMSTEERNAEDKVYNDRANLRNELIFSAAGIKDRNRRMSNIQKTIQSEVDEVQSSFRDSLGGRSVMFGVSENLSNILSEQQPGHKGIKTWKEPGTREAQQAFVDEVVGVDEQGNKIYTAGAEIDPNVRIEDQNIAVQPDRYDAETQYEETKLKLEELIFQVGQRDALAAEKITELSRDYLSLLATNKVSIEAYNKLASDKYAQEQWTNALNKNIEDKVQQNADKEGLRIAQEAKTSKEIYDNLTVEVSPAVLPQIRERIEQLKKDETEARNKYLNQVKTLNPKDKVEALKEIDKEGLTDSEKEGLRLALDQAQVALTKDKLQNPSDEVTEEDVEVKEVKEEIEEAFNPENVGGVESISENGREFQIEGKQYYNREANPQDAIVTDAKGDLVSIKLQTEDGVTESFRAPKARIEALHVAILKSTAYKVDSTQDIARQDILNRAGVVLEESKNELAVSIKDNTKDSSSLKSEIYGLERSIDEVLEVIDELRTSLIQDDNATKKDINANSTIKELNKRLKQIKAAITKRRNVLLNRNESSTPTIAEITAVEQKVLNDVQKLEDKIKDLEAQALEVENTLRRTESQMEDYQNDPASFAQVAKENADAITKSNNIEEKQKTFYTLIDYKKQKLRRLQNEKQNRPANPAEQTTPEAPGEIEKPATEGENPNITTVPKEERVTIAANLGYQRVNNNSYVISPLGTIYRTNGPRVVNYTRIKDATDVNIPGYSEVEAFTYKDQNGITNVVDSLTGTILGKDKVAKLAGKQAVETLNQNTPTEFFKNVINENEKTSPAYEPTNVAEEAENFTPSEQRTQKVITLENGKLSIIEAGNEKGPGQRGGMVVMTQAEVEEHDRQVSKNLSEVISEAAEQEIDEDKPYGNTQSIRELVDSANRDIDGIGENFLTYEEGERQLQEIIDLIDKRVRMNQILLDKGKEAYSVDKVIEEVMYKHNTSDILRQAQIGQVAALKRYIKRKMSPTQPTTAAPVAPLIRYGKESIEDLMKPIDFDTLQKRTDGKKVPTNISFWGPSDKSETYKSETPGEERNKYTAEIIPTNPFIVKKSEVWTVGRLKSIIAKGHDAIIVDEGGTRGITETIPLDKSIIKLKDTTAAQQSSEVKEVAPMFEIINKDYTSEDSLFPTAANKALGQGMRALYDSGVPVKLSINRVDPDNIGIGSLIQDADVGMVAFSLSVEGNNIGSLAVNYKTNEIVNVEILPEFRGLGLGTKLYKAAAEELVGLKSDPSFLSNKAENIWKSLVKQGLAVKTNVKAKGTNAGYAMIDSAVQPTQQASEVKEGASEVFNDSSELSSIGTEQQYSSYLDTVFPDSKVEDIVYHGTDYLFDKFQKKVNPSNNYKGNKYNGGWFFAGRKETSESYTGSKALAKITNFLSISKDKSPNVYSILLNVKNPVIEDRKGERGIGFDEVNKAISDGKDAYIAKNVVDPNVLDDVYVVFNEENIHILGSKQDIQGFKEFVSKSAAPVEQQIKKSEYEVHVTGDMVSGWDVSTTVFNVPGIKINDLRSKTTAEGKNGRLFTESVQNNKKVFTLTDASIYRGSRPAGVSASMVFNENTTRTLESVEGNLTAIMDNLMGVIKKGSASFTPTNINFDWKKLDVKEIATPSVTMQDSEKDSAQTPIVKTIMPTVFTKDARNNPDTFKPWFIDTVSDSADNKKIYKEISNLVKIGKNLDNKITTWSLGDLRANIDGRPMVSIDIPETGESFIMYKSTGTGSGANSKGLWTPIPGFAKNGWFVKQIWNGGNPKITKYNIKTFQEIHDWLSIPGVSDSFGLEPGSKVVDSTLPSSFSMSLTVGMAATTKFKTKPGEKFQSYIPVNSEGLPIPHNPDTVNGEIIEIDKSPLLSPDIINKEVEFEIIRNDWFKKESANSTKPIHSYVPIYFKIDGKRVGKLKTGNTEDRKVIVEKLNAGEKVVSTVDTVRANNFNAAKTEDGKPWFSNPNAIGMEDVVLLFTDMDMTNGVSTVKWTAGENLNKDADGPSSDILAINREKANINSGQVGILIKDKYNPGGADRVTPGSTQFLTNKAIEAVVTNLIDKNHKIASQIVANSSEKMRSTSVSDTFLEFLTNDKQVKTMVYKSPSTNKLIRINEHELSKALSGKSYIKDVVEPTGADELSLEYTAIPQDQLTNKDIDLNVKEDFRNFLDLKKYHIDMSFGNSVGVYTSPVTNDTYKNYNEYLFSEQEIGEERADGSGHNSIFATDLVQIDGSFFHNPQVTFTKGDVNGNTAETIKADTEAKSKIKPAEKTELDNLIDEMGLLGEDTVPDCS